MNPECLKALHANEEEALRLYLSLHRTALTVLENNGCSDADTCADEVMMRFCTKARKEIIRHPRALVLRITYHVLQECYRKMKAEKDAATTFEQAKIANTNDTSEKNTVDDKKAACRRSCLRRLPDSDRLLLAQYFVVTGNDKLKVIRKKLATQMGLPQPQLRKKVFNILRHLEECIVECLAKQLGNGRHE